MGQHLVVLHRNNALPWIPLTLIDYCDVAKKILFVDALGPTLCFGSSKVMGSTELVGSIRREVAEQRRRPEETVAAQSARALV